MVSPPVRDSEYLFGPGMASDSLVTNNHWKARLQQMPAFLACPCLLSSPTNSLSKLSRVLIMTLLQACNGQRRRMRGTCVTGEPPQQGWIFIGRQAIPGQGQISFTVKIGENGPCISLAWPPHPTRKESAHVLANAQMVLEKAAPIASR